MPFCTLVLCSAQLSQFGLLQHQKTPALYMSPSLCEYPLGDQLLASVSRGKCSE